MAPASTVTGGRTRSEPQAQVRRALTDIASPGSPPPTPPSRRRQVVLFGLAACLSGFTLLRGYDPHDDGLMLQAGARIASGQIPYRDFWMNYTPGQAVVLAGLDKVFGVSLLSWRILRVAIDATVALMGYRLARRLAPEWLALVVWVAVAGAMAWPTGPGPNPPALALAFAALLVAPRRPLVAGALAGFAVFFRLEIGAAAALGVILCVPAGARLRAALAAVALAVISLGPFFVADPAAMWHDTIGFLGIQHLQHLPFPLRYAEPWGPTKLLDFYFPLILLVGSGLWVLAALSATWRGRGALGVAGGWRAASRDRAARSPWRRSRSSVWPT